MEAHMQANGDAKETLSVKSPKVLAEGIVNLFVSPDEFSPLRGFFEPFHGLLFIKRGRKNVSLPHFSEKINSSMP
jgi:hypothetical protein